MIPKGSKRPPFSAEWKKNLSESRKGAKHWYFGKKRPPFSDEARRRMSEGQKGKKHSLETRQKMSVNRRGEKGNNWKGGLARLQSLIRGSFENRQWRSDVFSRDGYTCQDCGDDRGGNLNADHIKPFALILWEYDIKTFEEALKCEEL